MNDNLKHIPYPTVNGVILVKYKALWYVVLSAAKAEIVGIFHNVQVAIPIQYILEKLEHLQPLTLIKMDNSMVLGFINNNIYQKCSKSWDMYYYWLCNQ